MKIRLYDFAGEKRRETERAFLIFDGTKEIWFPKACTEDNGDGTFTVPEWLAIEKEIV